MASTTNDAKAKAAERKKQFFEVWPKLENELVDMMKKHAMPEDATEWFRRVRFRLFLIGFFTDRSIDH